jgi:cytochrome c oxidase assembly protein subunit 15
LIDGAFIPPREHLFLLAPAWLNLLDNHLAVQFTHRMVAYVLVAVGALHAADCSWHRVCRRSAVALALFLLLQAMLGIATLLLQVPILLALAHQAVAIAALIAATLHAANLRVQPELSFQHAAQ